MASRSPWSPLGMGALRLALILAFTAATPDGWRMTFTAELFWPRVVFWADVNLFTYLAVVLTGRALASHRRYLDRTLRTHVLETQLARAQLHFLELQLQPHFLFNSLNAIQELEAAGAGGVHSGSRRCGPDPTVAPCRHGPPPRRARSSARTT